MTSAQPNNEEFHSTSVDKIIRAYNGEVYGIAFFEYFLAHYPHPSNRVLWQKLIEIEKLTADILHTWLTTSDVTFENAPKSMQHKGQLEAEQWINLPWKDLIDTLLPWIEPYENMYCQWEDTAHEHRQIFTIIAEHETAIFHCWQQEQQGKNGIEALKAFIDRYTQHDDDA